MPTWEIENMERKPDDGFVITAHWRVTDEQDGFTGTRSEEHTSELQSHSSLK